MRLPWIWTTTSPPADYRAMPYRSSASRSLTTVVRGTQASAWEMAQFIDSRPLRRSLPASVLMILLRLPLTWCRPIVSSKSSSMPPAASSTKDRFRGSERCLPLPRQSRVLFGLTSSAGLRWPARVCWHCIPRWPECFELSWPTSLTHRTGIDRAAPRQPDRRNRRFL